MFEFLIVVISIIGVLMTLGILLQSGKGGGLAGIASGGATTQILGSRQAPDFLEKTTWTLGGLFIVLCILTTFTIDTDGTTDSIIQTQTATQPLVPSTTGSDAGAAAGTDDGAPSGSDSTPPPSGDDGNN
jgi:preprotein translocase subunit SecG